MKEQKGNRLNKRKKRRDGGILYDANMHELSWTDEYPERSAIEKKRARNDPPL